MNCLSLLLDQIIATNFVTIMNISRNQERVEYGYDTTMFSADRELETPPTWRIDIDSKNDMSDIHDNSVLCRRSIREQHVHH